MKMKMYAVKDKKAEAYLQPMSTATDGVAIRMIQGAMEQDNNLSKHPEDFSLWHIGYYDELTGKIEGLEDIICIGQLTDLDPRQKVQFSDTK